MGGMTVIINFDFKYGDKENLPRGFATQIQEQSISVWSIIDRS